MKLLETSLLDYDMMAPFIVPDFIDEYALKVENIWGQFFCYKRESV